MSLRILSSALLATAVICGGLHARAQVGQILPSGSLSSITGCAADTTLQARMDGGQNATAITSAICGLVADSTFAKLDGLYVFATNSEANAQQNWRQNAFNLTKTGSPAFSANNGYTGNGAGYFLTGFNPSTAGGQTIQDGASIGFCMNTAETAATAFQIGAYDGTNITAVEAHSTTQVGAYINSLNTQFANLGSGNTAAAIQVVRTTSTNMRFYRNLAVTGNSPVKTSNGLPNVEYALLGRNDSGVVTTPSNKQFAWFAFGGLLNDGQVFSLYNRLHAYLFAVGATTAC